MGCFFGMARQREVAGNASGARTYYWLAFLLPVIEHGFYDAALSSESDLMVLLALGVEIAFIIFAMVHSSGWIVMTPDSSMPSMDRTALFTWYRRS